jgi:hypothetical protein
LCRTSAILYSNAKVNLFLNIVIPLTLDRRSHGLDDGRRTVDVKRLTSMASGVTRKEIHIGDLNKSLDGDDVLTQHTNNGRP